MMTRSENGGESKSHDGGAKKKKRMNHQVRRFHHDDVFIASTLANWLRLLLLAFATVFNSNQVVGL